MRRVSDFDDDLDDLTNPPEESPTGKSSPWELKVSADGATFSGILTDDQDKEVGAGDWSRIFKHFGYDAAIFEILEPVTHSSWQQSARAKNGHRDMVWLHSYKNVRFRRIIPFALADEDVAELRERVQKWKPIRRTPGAGLGPPATFFVGQSDWQLGKPGTAAFVTQRILDSLSDSVRRVKDLRRIGRNIESIAVWNMGDPVEGVTGHYSTQTFQVELNMRDQQNLALDLMTDSIRALVPLVDDFEYGALLCNHGENRQNGKKVSDDADNASGFLADTLEQRVFKDLPGFGHIRWLVPRDEMIMTSDMSGVPVALSHGHTMPGSAREMEWMRAQSMRLFDLHRIQPELWLLAHRHHLSVMDYGPFRKIGHPSADEGSKWWTDLTGLYSAPGLLTALVGRHAEASRMGFSDLAVL